MRILHVHSGNIFGGVERILIALAGHKKFSPEFSHSFALCFPGRLANELAEAGAEVFLLPKFRLTRPWELVRARASLRNLLTSHKFDLAIVHSAWSHIAFASVVAAAGLPLLFWLHTTAGNSLLEKLARLRFPTRVLSVSHAVNQTAPFLFPGIPSDIVYSPLALDEVAFAGADRNSTRSSLGATPDQVVLLQASRLEPWKGHVQLIEALIQLRENQNWTCWVAGDGDSEYQDRLRLKASPLAGRIKFLGPRNDILDLLMSADIYCQPNLEGEGFSIAFMEASYASLPIITSAIGGATEIVDSETGILLPRGDVPKLAQALQRLIENRELRQQLGSNARKRVLQLCNPGRQFRELERVFHKTIASHV